LAKRVGFCQGLAISSAARFSSFANVWQNQGKIAEHWQNAFRLQERRKASRKVAKFAKGETLKSNETRFTGIEKLPATKNARESKFPAERKRRREFPDRIHGMDRIGPPEAGVPEIKRFRDVLADLSWERAP
jgi:hypothetical protein